MTGNRPLTESGHPESGNVILFILLAIVLIGLVTAALRQGSDGDANIDSESLTVNATRVKQYAGELEHAVVMILGNGVSEADIRFAHPDAPSDYGTYTVDPERQVFNPKGGGAEYRAAPPGVNDGSGWEFYGHTALPGVGGDRADLVAVLPNVTQAFCDKINQMDGYNATPDDDGGAQTNCVHGGAALRFDTANQYTDPGDTTDEASFSVVPAMEGCALCAADGKLHFFHVLHAR